MSSIVLPSHAQNTQRERKWQPFRVWNQPSTRETSRVRSVIDYGVRPPTEFSHDVFTNRVLRVFAFQYPKRVTLLFSKVLVVVGPHLATWDPMNVVPSFTVGA